NRGKTPGGFGNRPYRSAVEGPKMAEFRASHSDFERMLHLRARTFAPVTHFWDCLEIGGVRPQLLLAEVDRWRGRISVRSRSRACRCRQHNEPAAADRPLVATN